MVLNILVWWENVLAVLFIINGVCDIDFMLLVISKLLLFVLIVCAVNFSVFSLELYKWLMVVLEIFCGSFVSKVVIWVMLWLFFFVWLV